MPGAHRIDAAFADAPPGLWPFLPAGYPSLEVTTGLLRAMNDLPIRGVELGFPFSDPIADGPVIQHAFSEALVGGLRVARVFDAVAEARPGIRYPLLAMVSASIVYRLGLHAFVERARAAGFDGLIVPDLSLEEAPGLSEAARGADLRLSLLVAPTTPPDRRRRIAAAASGFLYYVSVQGTTGSRDRLPAELESQVRALKTESRLPILVGFGISRPEQVRAVCGYADGAIVGSAIVRAIEASIARSNSRADLVASTAGFIRELAI